MCGIDGAHEEKDSGHSRVDTRPMPKRHRQLVESVRGSSSNMWNVPTEATVHLPSSKPVDDLEAKEVKQMWSKLAGQPQNGVLTIRYYTKLQVIYTARKCFFLIVKGLWAYLAPMKYF